MDSIELHDLINRISYKPGYHLVLAGRILQASFEREDTYTGEPGVGFGSPVAIPADAEPGDVVRTAFGLFKAIEEHECREWFRVDGVQPFSPHIELDAMLDAGRHIQGHPEPGSDR